MLSLLCCRNSAITTLQCFSTARPADQPFCTASPSMQSSSRTVPPIMTRSTASRNMCPYLWAMTVQPSPSNLTLLPGSSSMWTRKSTSRAVGDPRIRPALCIWMRCADLTPRGYHSPYRCTLWQRMVQSSTPTVRQALPSPCSPSSSMRLTKQGLRWRACPSFKKQGEMQRLSCTFRRRCSSAAIKLSCRENNAQPKDEARQSRTQLAGLLQLEQPNQDAKEKLSTWLSCALSRSLVSRELENECRYCCHISRLDQG